MNHAKITAKPGEPTITIERTFDAPPADVFDAMVQADKLKRWWIGPGFESRIDHLDARDGGSWKITQVDGKGQAFSFHGSYHEVTSPRRIIRTFEFGDTKEGRVSLEKTELSEATNGKTNMNITIVFLNVTDRDTMLQSGMEAGTQAGYNALDKLLKEK